MWFDVSIAHEEPCTRVIVIGEATLGRLLSLLNVLEVDSAAWPRPAMLLDLRGLRAPLSREAEARLAAEAARGLPRLRKIGVLAGEPGPELARVRFFAELALALQWLAA